MVKGRLLCPCPPSAPVFSLAELHTGVLTGRGLWVAQHLYFSFNDGQSNRETLPPVLKTSNNEMSSMQHFQLQSFQTPESGLLKIMRLAEQSGIFLNKCAVLFICLLGFLFVCFMFSL